LTFIQLRIASLLESASALGFGPPSGTKAAGTANLQLQLRREFADPLRTFLHW
jgi:hypothetical protein